MTYEQATMLARFNAGFTQSEIAESMGTTKGVVSGVLFRARRKATPERVMSAMTLREEQIVSLNKRGVSAAEIAAICGTTRGTVGVTLTQLRKRHGVAVVPYQQKKRQLAS